MIKTTKLPPRKGQWFIAVTVLHVTSDVLRGLIAMSEDELIIADRILALVQKRYRWQIARLQELLGVTDHFEDKTPGTLGKGE